MAVAAGVPPVPQRLARQRQIRLLDETAEWAFRSDAKREAARHADAQGIGSGDGFHPDGDDEET